MVDRRAVQLGRVACSASGWGRTPALQWSLPTPLDSGLRRNDVWRAGTTSAGGGVQALSRPRNIIFVPIAHKTGPLSLNSCRLFQTTP